jgi:hypothetical protein
MFPRCPPHGAAIHAIVFPREGPTQALPRSPGTSLLLFIAPRRCGPTPSGPWTHTCGTVCSELVRSLPRTTQREGLARASRATPVRCRFPSRVRSPWPVLLALLAGAGAQSVGGASHRARGCERTRTRHPGLRLRRDEVCRGCRVEDHLGVDHGPSTSAPAVGRRPREDARHLRAELAPGGGAAHAGRARGRLEKARLSLRRGGLERAHVLHHPRRARDEAGRDAHRARQRVQEARADRRRRHHTCIAHAGGTNYTRAGSGLFAPSKAFVPEWASADLSVKSRGGRSSLDGKHSTRAKSQSAPGSMLSTGQACSICDAAQASIDESLRTQVASLPAFWKK